MTTRNSASCSSLSRAIREDWSGSSWSDRYRWLLVTTYNGNQAALSRALGVVPQTVANILPGGDPSAATVRATPW